MSKHTPAPWEQYGRQIFAPGINMVYAPAVNRANICELSEPRASKLVEHMPLELGSPDRDEALANGNLIAEAPNLLLAAKHVIEWFSELESHEYEATIDTLRRAVAKAEGSKA